MSLSHLNRKQQLIVGLVFDAIGMLSYFIPLIDIIWAPLSAYLILKMYPGSIGKVSGIVSFIEEAVPGFDFFPTFTLTWVYVALFKKD